MIDSIIEAIMAEAEERAKTEAELTAEKINDMYARLTAEKNAAAEKAAAELEKEAERIYSAEKSRNEQKLKTALLETKTRCIKNAAQNAKQKILSMPDSDYENFLKRQYEKVTTGEKGTVYLNERDKKRVKSDTFSGCTVSDKCIKTDGGFILEYDKVDYDCRIDSLFEEKYNEICDAVNSVYSEGK